MALRAGPEDSTNQKSGIFFLLYHTTGSIGGRKFSPSNEGSVSTNATTVFNNKTNKNTQSKYNPFQHLRSSNNQMVYVSEQYTQDFYQLEKSIKPPNKISFQTQHQNPFPPYLQHPNEIPIPMTPNHPFSSLHLRLRHYMPEQVFRRPSP